jgi:serine/threonine-protein kinase PpkA
VNSTVLLKSVDINIPGYRILRPIGEGGMASVFLAVQESLDREVALKVMSPALAANAEFASRFLTEGKITAKLQHPNLVTVYDIGTHNGIYYLAAEYIPAGTLKERITEGGMSVADILDVISDIALGLDFAHQKGFVHRDVKPGNVLFRNDGRVVLADFGIAKAMDGSNSSTVAGSSIGTPDYMSPEQARGEPVDGRSDLYSLGSVLYEMFVGHPPYQAADPFTVALMHVTHPLPELPDEYSWLQPLIQGLMAKNQTERYNTGAAFVEALHALIANAPKGAMGVSTRVRKPGSANRLSGSAATAQRTRVSMSNQGEGKRSGLWLAVGAVGVLGIGIAAWQIFKSPAEVSDASDSNAQSQSSDNATNVPANPIDNTAGMSMPVDDGSDAIINATDEDIETWLTQADIYLKQNLDGSKLAQNVDEPENSAVALYSKVLSARPDDERAKKGLKDTADFLASFAKRSCDSDRYGGCKTNIDRALRIDPGNTEYLKLRDLAESKIREQLQSSTPPTQ